MRDIAKTKIPSHLVHPCFFCLRREATQQLSNVKWPFPIPPEAVVLMCKKCSKLGATEMARAIAAYADDLRTMLRREIANRN